MKKRSKFLLVAMLLTGFSGAFTSCQEDAPEINYTTTITVINDFTKVVEAINNGSIKQAEAIAKLTEAIDNMKASQDAKLKAIADEINSQKNTLETKLQLLEAAMNAQTVAFNEKMKLLEDAIKGNTDMIKDKGQLIADAIDAMKGSMEDKLKEIRDAIETAGNNTAEKLDLIKGAMEAQTLAFNEKMALLEDAIKGNTDMIKDKGQLIADAIDAMKGSMEDKLKEIRDAIEAAGNNTAEKLDLIKGAMEAQTLAFNEKMALLEDAIKGNTDMIKDKGQLIADAIDAIQGSMEDKLKEIRDAIETAGNNTAAKLDLIKGAMEAQTLAFNEKMKLLEDAIKGLDCKTQIEAISEALNNILTQMQADANTQGEIKTQLENAVTAINNLKEQVKNGNKSEADALAEIIAKLEALKGSVGGGSGTGGEGGTGGGSGTGGEGGTGGGSGTGGEGGTGGGSGTGGGITTPDFVKLTKMAGANQIRLYTPLYNITVWSQKEGSTSTTGSLFFYVDLNDNGKLDGDYDGKEGLGLYEAAYVAELTKTFSISNEVAIGIIHNELTPGTTRAKMSLSLANNGIEELSGNCGEVKILSLKGNNIRALQLAGPHLNYLDLSSNQLTTLDVSNLSALTQLKIAGNKISGVGMDNLVNSLPVTTSGVIDVTSGDTDATYMTLEQARKAKGKGWKLRQYDGKEWVNYNGKGSAESSAFLTYSGTKHYYYEWDAVDPVDGMKSEYNTIELSTDSPTNSCKVATTESDMEVYLGNSVVWDNGEAGENQQSYTIDGKTYHAGLWVKKWGNCSKDMKQTSVNGAPYFSSGRPGASAIDRFFFIPACGYYKDGKIVSAGASGHYWSSSFYDKVYGDKDKAYCLIFSASGVQIKLEDRTLGFIPMVSK